MKRLVGEQKQIDTYYGDKSDPYGKNYYFEFAECLQWIDYKGDPSVVADVDKICIDAFNQGFLLDRVDAYYAWSEYSQEAHATWLIGANLESCRKFLVEIEVSEKRPTSFPEINKEADELEQVFLKWNAAIKGESNGH